MAKMLKDNGHHVTFYGAEGSDTPCDELVVLVPSELISEGLVLGDNGVPQAAWKNDLDGSIWQTYIANGREALRARYRTGDIALVSFGWYQKFVEEIATLSCEFMVGYSGIFSHHKVFPSSAWMHYLYGVLQLERNPPWGDAVIPHYLDLNDFQVQPKKDDYILCLGRIDRDKGTDIAIDVANRAGMKLIVAGVDMVTHDIPQWVRKLPGDVEFTGYVDTKKRLELLRGAKALIHPCRWLEPFGMVLIEALACGTPIIASDWGALPEIIDQGVTGYCCRDMAEFVSAVNHIHLLDPWDCRAVAESKYSLEAVYPQYLRYFKRLQKLLGGGWYETRGLWRGPDVVERIKDLQPNGRLRGAEIGVDRGALSAYLLTELPNLYLDMVDTWGVFPDDSEYVKSEDGVTERTQTQRDEDLCETLRVTKHASARANIIRDLSENAATSIKDGSLDFVFIDADHSYAGVSADIKLWAHKIRIGGILCGHDFGMEQFYPHWGVTQAVTEYALSINKRVQLGSDWTWFIEV